MCTNSYEMTFFFNYTKNVQSILIFFSKSEKKVLEVKNIIITKTKIETESASSYTPFKAPIDRWAGEALSYRKNYSMIHPSGCASIPSEPL